MCVHFSFVLFYLSAENDDLAHSDAEWQSCSMLSLSDSLLDPGDILMGDRMVVRGGGEKVSSPMWRVWHSRISLESIRVMEREKLSLKALLEKMTSFSGRIGEASR
jgi:hypothetical protein